MLTLYSRTLDLESNNYLEVKELAASFNLKMSNCVNGVRQISDIDRLISTSVLWMTEAKQRKVCQCPDYLQTTMYINVCCGVHCTYPRLRNLLCVFLCRY